ncbi:MAG: hypothetical protein M3Q71_20865 [Chloroflexota bacterium]|nr:hypothetical protein [Chloroflexota bacterium]
MTQPSIIGPTTGATHHSETGDAIAPHAGAAPPAGHAGLDELAAMLADLGSLNLDGVVPMTAFDPRWPEVDPQ